MIIKQFHTPAGIIERELAASEADPILKAEYEKDKSINDNMPDWITVSNVIDNINSLSDARVFIKKLSRIVYLIAKSRSD